VLRPLATGGYLPAMPPVSHDRTPLLVGALIALAALVVIGVMALSGDDEPEPDPTPTAAPEPEPEPEPEPPGPVEGEYELVRVTDLSVHGRRVFEEGMPQNDPVEPDAAAVEAFVAGMAAWLDGHFTDLQDGGPGWAADAGVAGPVEVLTLTDPDHPVEHASYAITVWARTEPEWARANVALTRTDGSTLHARLVFTPGDPPALVAAVGEGTPPEEEPPAEDEEGEA
jgi:hypothetical protein